MLSKPKAHKAPKLFLTTGEAAVAFRNKLALSQTEFWSRVSVKQPGGSRYESGRNLPGPVQILLHFAYAPEVQAHAMLSHLRRNQEKSAA